MDAEVLIVGAGLSGLVAARELTRAGVAVTVVDKSRSSGGRLASRRILNGVADHGAQFFTARTPEFQAQVDAWMAEGLVSIWGYGWSDGSLKRTVNDGHARYIVQGGMNQLAKTLETQLSDVRVNITVTKVNYAYDGWRVLDSEGHIYTSQGLILTPPVPQSLALLGDIPLHETDRAALERIEYGPCLCGMFVIEGDVDLPEPGALQNFNQEIYWLADNQRKGISPNQRIITAHAEARGSRQRFEESDEKILAWLRQPLERLLVNDAHITEQHLKKWRYSVPLTTHPDDVLDAEGLNLIFAGDAFGGRGRVEGAYLSGLTAGQTLLRKLGKFAL